jgi:hypothetical protein
MTPLRHIAFALCIAMSWLLASPTHASVANAPAANLEIALITYGPGETYWERFGHDALQVRDTVSGESVNFNYGEFDFDQENFFLNFARGRMNYMMGAALSDIDESYYIETGRSITRQRLALTTAQAGALRDFLLWNLRPENSHYGYDYYVDNCATRVRNALDQALGGALKAQLAARLGGMTYRQQTLRLMSNQPALMLVLDLGLGPYADHPLTLWQESFIPMVLQSAVENVRVDDGKGGWHPLVSDSRIVSANRLDTPPASAPDLRRPLALAGLCIATLMLLARRFWPTGFTLLGTLYALAAGFVGLVLLVLWTLTTHHSAWANANLLLFNPLAWLLLPALWRARHGVTPSRFIDGVIAVQMLAAVVAVLLHLLPGVVQQNQPWLLFSLPIWLVLAWRLRRPA